MQAKLIKTAHEYEVALRRIESLLALKDVNSKETDELELLVHLVEMYEDEEYPIDLPSPIEAIKFKMEQQGLKQKDLIPFIGSKSKVSEVLSGKRPLTLNMIRALSSGLNISADILVQEPLAELPRAYQEMDYSKFPILEMYKRGLTASYNYKEQAEEIFRHLLRLAGSPATFAACLRQGHKQEKNSEEKQYALLMWEILVRAKANQICLENTYNKEKFSYENIKRIANLSIYADGAIKAQEYLARHGIILIIEQGFKKSCVDGVAMLREDGTPVIGLSLRFDRIDYFWFTLLHELAHIMLHLDTMTPCILDEEMQSGNVSEDALVKKRETEADNFASNALIPDAVWHESEAKRTISTTAIRILAAQLDIHPAIIAGKIRKMRNDYTLHTKLLGSGTIRVQFGL